MRELREIYNSTRLLAMQGEVEGLGKRIAEAVGESDLLQRDVKSLQAAYRTADNDAIRFALMLELADLVEASRRASGKVEKLTRDRDILADRLQRARQIYKWSLA